MNESFWLVTALLIGFSGSFHCVGMCGPIALSLPIGNKSISTRSLGIILYNLGRALTYGIMGLVVGFIGVGFSLAGFQEWTTIIIGAFMILMVIFPGIYSKINIGTNKIGLLDNVKSELGKLFKSQRTISLFIIGLLNGLLPCGLVYMALAAAMATGTFYEAAMFMVVFGLATAPMMFVVSFAGSLLSVSFRKTINKISPYIVVFIGILFILRGLNLGIPYISPSEKKLHIPQKAMIDSKTEHQGDSCPHCR